MKQPFAAFIENATIGILSKEAWQGTDGDNFIASDLNVKPIGSGPYKDKILIAMQTEFLWPMSLKQIIIMH